VDLEKKQVDTQEESLWVREDLFEIENHEVGEFYISMVLRNRTSNYRWEMIMVYG
jgi:hypothetical protein